MIQKKLILCASFFSLFFIQAAFAGGNGVPNEIPSRNSDYKCSGKGMRGPDVIKIVGIGANKGGGDGTEISFCKNSLLSKECYMTQETLQTLEGEAIYKTLLTARILGQKIMYHCNGSWIDSVYLVR